MSPKIKEPKDLGVTMGTPEQVFWTDVKNKCEDSILRCKREIVIQEHILRLTKEQIIFYTEKGNI